MPPFSPPLPLRSQHPFAPRRFSRRTVHPFIWTLLPLIIHPSSYLHSFPPAQPRVPFLLLPFSAKMIPRLRSQKASRHTHAQVQAQRLHQLLISVNSQPIMTGQPATVEEALVDQQQQKDREEEKKTEEEEEKKEKGGDRNQTEDHFPNGHLSPGSPLSPTDISRAFDRRTSAPVQIRMNVGGRSAQLTLEKIRQRADRSRLSQFAEKDHAQRVLECDAFLNGEYYFERSATVFENILDYYVTGKLHRPMEICPIRWRDELEFWRIPLTALAECCRSDAFLSKRSLASPALLSMDNVYVESTCPPAEFEGVAFSRVRLILWTFLENPRSSAAAKVLSVVSASFVLLSLAGLILSSMKEFQINDGMMSPVLPLQLAEICCMLFFTLEYLLRFAVIPHKWSFVKQPLNIIDLLTIVPFLLEACLPLLGVNDIELRNFRGALIVIRVLRLARVARIFKLARYSIGLRAFGETMRKSAAELSMLGMFLLTGIMLFSTAIYFFERDEPNSKFYSIPSAWWWCVATMTTVGYGDLVPVTTGGKVVAAIASVCGIIVLAFPISMIIDKFAESTGHGQRVFDETVAQGEVPLEANKSNVLFGSPTGRGMSRRRTKSRRYLF